MGRGVVQYCRRQATGKTGALSQWMDKDMGEWFDEKPPMIEDAGERWKPTETLASDWSTLEQTGVDWRRLACLSPGWHWWHGGECLENLENGGLSVDYVE